MESHKLQYKPISTIPKVLENDPPTIYFYEDPKQDKAHFPGDDAVKCTITSGWELADKYSVDKEGFAVRPFLTQFDKWEEEAAVAEAFYPEIVDFLKKTVGAKRVLVFDHTIRTAANAQKKITDTNTVQRAPVMLVHCDYTNESGPLRVKQLLKDEADNLLKSRVGFFNVWKPIHKTVEERPLAMCDVTSTSPDDFMKLYLHYPDRIGENYVMRHSDRFVLFSLFSISVADSSR